MRSPYKHTIYAALILIVISQPLIADQSKQASEQIACDGRLFQQMLDKASLRVDKIQKNTPALKKAAESGDLAALYHFGLNTYFNFDLPKEKRVLGLDIMNRAANEGSQYAQFNLTGMYLNGAFDGSFADLDKAYRLGKQHALAGSVVSQREIFEILFNKPTRQELLDLLDTLGKRVFIQEGDFFLYYLWLAARQGDKKSIFHLRMFINHHFAGNWDLSEEEIAKYTRDLKENARKGPWIDQLLYGKIMMLAGRVSSLNHEDPLKQWEEAHVWLKKATENPKNKEKLGRNDLKCIVEYIHEYR
ncbi:MAG: sel1 repeat family protein [Magnetococcales bacterium]|nr:sel1 repeat family protein [Magnetococcales bacterium]MBF0589018.1 sel1 repeat family protein [Magnetococcales bacterium]